MNESFTADSEFLLFFSTGKAQSRKEGVFMRNLGSSFNLSGREQEVPASSAVLLFFMQSRSLHIR